MKKIWLLLFALCVLLAACSPKPQQVEVTRLVEITSTAEPTADTCPASEAANWTYIVAPILQETAGVIGNAFGSIAGAVPLEEVVSTIDQDIAHIDAGMGEINENDPPSCLVTAQFKALEGMINASLAMKNFRRGDIASFSDQGMKAADAIIASLEIAESLGLLEIEN